MSLFICKLKLTPDQSNLFHYTAEASDLRFPVGKWPRHVPTSAGNQMPFSLVSTSHVNGELQSCRYEQSYGPLSLTVFND